jgi:Flp pilus assembly protein TadG
MWADRRGVAATEFGFFAIFLSAALANVTDVSIYIYQRMQVENAAEIAAQAALKTCSTKLPATTTGDIQVSRAEGVLPLHLATSRSIGMACRHSGEFPRQPPVRRKGLL